MIRRTLSASILAALFLELQRSDCFARRSSPAGGRSRQDCVRKRGQLMMNLNLSAVTLGGVQCYTVTL